MLSYIATATFLYECRTIESKNFQDVTDFWDNLKDLTNQGFMVTVSLCVR